MLALSVDMLDVYLMISYIHFLILFCSLAPFLLGVSSQHVAATG